MGSQLLIKAGARSVWGTEPCVWHPWTPRSSGAWVDLIKPLCELEKLWLQGLGSRVDHPGVTVLGGECLSLSLVAISAARSARLRVPPPRLFIRTGLPGATYLLSLAGTWTLSRSLDFSPLLLLLLPAWLFFFFFFPNSTKFVSVSKTEISLKMLKCLPGSQIFCLLHFSVAAVPFLWIWATIFTLKEKE